MLLTEDRASKNISFARRYIMSNGYSQEQAQQVIDSIRHDIPNVRLAQYKFILGVTRMYLTNQLQSGREIGELNKTLKYVASEAHVNEYNYDLNGEDYITLTERFKGVAKSDLESDMAASNSRQYTVNENYTIVPIDNPKEAAKYGKYTSWCVTHDKNMYNSYTHNGTGRFYFCLHKGFENEPEEQGEGCPLDNYGLSMIAVSVDMEGAVNTITCRWNHDMGGNDNVMTIEQLEQVIGRNFYQTFKPYSREELHTRGIILFDEVQELLDSGKQPEDIFEDVDAFEGGFAIVILNDKYNFINTEGRLISNQWFDYVGYFYKGFAKVILNGKYNFINTEGRLISNQWFDYALGFNEGFAEVKLNGKWLNIYSDGTLAESKNIPKTIYITEEQEKVLSENILLDSLPEDITNTILKNGTSLKNNPAIPNIFEHSYLEKIMNKRFVEVTDELKKIGEINDVPDNNIPTVLNKLILKCQEIEKPYRSELEKLCYNYLVDLFDIPDDTVTIDFRLVDEVEIDTHVIKLDPVYGDDDEIEYDDLIQAETVRDEIYKRRMLDVLSMGAGMQVSSSIKSYLSDIYDIEPKLPDLYRKILALNNYLLLTRENLDMTEENHMQMGTVEIILGNEKEKVRINAQGEIFPVLLSECVRGFMELFASHGLPKDKSVLDVVISKSDYLKAEPWDMRIGPSLWTILSESFGEIDFTTIPFLYKRIACLSCKNFNKLMQEVLAKTRTGKRLMGKLVEKSKKDKEYNKFSDKMSKLKTDKSIITDEYINEDEL